MATAVARPRRPNDFKANVGVALSLRVLGRQMFQQDNGIERMGKILTPKEAREIVARLTAEQRLPVETEIAALLSVYKRSRLKLIRGGRAAKNTVRPDV